MADADAWKDDFGMTVRLVDAGWGAELIAALRADTSGFRVICPFIKASALDRLLSLKPASIQVITRFNLVDFAEGVSDIAALRMLLDAGAQVRGVRKLHSKLYLFASRAIVTSANLTKAALDSNHERLSSRHAGPTSTIFGSAGQATFRAIRSMPGPKPSPATAPWAGVRATERPLGTSAPMPPLRGRRPLRCGQRPPMRRRPS